MENLELEAFISDSYLICVDFSRKFSASAPVCFNVSQSLLLLQE